MSNGKSDEVVDCTIIVGDRKRIISRTAAEEGLVAMREKAERGGYKGIYADDASFVRASMRELEKASKF